MEEIIKIIPMKSLRDQEKLKIKHNINVLLDKDFTVGEIAGLLGVSSQIVSLLKNNNKFNLPLEKLKNINTRFEEIYLLI